MAAVDSLATTTDLVERSREMIESVERWIEATEKLASLADEFGLAAEDVGNPDFPFSIAASMDIARRARVTACDVRGDEGEAIRPVTVLEEARELVALVGFFAERVAEEA